ncbi:hypothetical protein ACJ2CR_05435 [Myxococcus faecalis]
MIQQNAISHRLMNQSRYGGGRICFAFSCRWAREIMASAVWMNWSLKQTPDQRITAILLDLAEITKQHKLYGEQLDRDQATIDELKLTRLFAQQSRRIDDEEVPPDQDPTTLEIRRLTRGQEYGNGAYLTSTESGLALAFGLHLAGLGHWALAPGNMDSLQTSFDALMALVPKQSTCLLFFNKQGTSRAHAIGVYRSHGMTWQDWYVFDPNFGEFKFNAYRYARFALMAIATSLGMDSVRLMGVTLSTGRAIEV